MHSCGYEEAHDSASTNIRAFIALHMILLSQLKSRGEEVMQKVFQMFGST